MRLDHFCSLFGLVDQSNRGIRALLPVPRFGVNFDRRHVFMVGDTGDGLIARSSVREPSLYRMDYTRRRQRERFDTRSLGELRQWRWP